MQTLKNALKHALTLIVFIVLAILALLWWNTPEKQAAWKYLEQHRAR